MPTSIRRLARAAQCGPVKGPISPEELEAASRRLKKAIIERALGGELTHHFGYPAGGTKPEATTNHRNGTGVKTVRTDDGVGDRCATRSGRHV